MEDPYTTGVLLKDTCVTTESAQYEEGIELPINIDSYNKETILLLLAGFYDTKGDMHAGNTYKESYIKVTLNNKELLKKIKALLYKLGIRGVISKTKFEDNKEKTKDNIQYTFTIKDPLSLYNFCQQIPVKTKRNQGIVLAILIAIDTSKMFEQSYNNVRFARIKSIKDIGVQRIYNLTADDSHTYIANGIITHNTGGSEGSNFYGILEMLYNPRGYNVYALPNVFDKNSNGKGETIFFFGAYLNREGFYNKDGVSDITGTVLNILKRRYEIKYNSSDPTRITRVIAERPLTIQEAIMRRESSMFPAAALTDRVAELDLNPNEYDNVFTGNLRLSSDGTVEFSPTNCKVIREFPNKDPNTDGGIEIFQMPHTKNGKAIPGRYIASLDPVDDDSNSGGSLQSGFVFDLWTDEIVAEYTGRPAYAEDYYEQFRLLLLFYDARCNYENNKKGLFGYFSKMNCVYLLTETLDFLKDKQLAKTTFGNKSRGTVATLAVNNYARNLIRTWLISPIEEDNADENTVVRPKLSKIRNRALLKELIQWEPLGNYDRVSALGMLMLLREDKMIMFQGKVDPNKIEKYNSNYLGNDSFFDTYDNKTKGYLNNKSMLLM